MFAFWPLAILITLSAASPAIWLIGCLTVVKDGLTTYATGISSKPIMAISRGIFIFSFFKIPITAKAILSVAVNIAVGVVTNQVLFGKIRIQIRIII